MIIILFDSFSRFSLFPLTLTRPVAALRVGILTIAEKWQKHLNAPVSYYTDAYLQEKFPRKYGQENIFIDGSICPDDQLIQAISCLLNGQALYSKNTLIALKLSEAEARDFNLSNLSVYQAVEYLGYCTQLVFPEDIFKFNDAQIRADFNLLTKDRASAKLSATNQILGNDIFIEAGVWAECSTFNTLDGPIYIGKNTQIMEGSHIRGSFALCEGAQVKMGAKIYGMTTIGPNCKVGGEINNAVLIGYSSKGHEGFLGNSVIGEWCNIGADSNTSNLKNNYNEVRLWDYDKAYFRKTGLQFCGLIMADHAKCAINTMFNTGTVVGVGANVFGANFPPNFVPDFSWGGGAEGFVTYKLDKLFETAEKVFERRGKVFGAQDKAILTHVFSLTERSRHVLI